MKVIQINCVYKNGSTGKIVYDIHIELQKQGIESIVCYGRGIKINEPYIYKTCGELYSKFNNLCSRITGIMYNGCFFSTLKLISIIKKENPDIVHLHCINGYFVNIYKLIKFLKKNRFKTVLTLHAEFMHTANCGYALDCERWQTGCGSCPRWRQETKSILFDRTNISWRKMQNAFKGFDENLTIVSVSPWLMNRAIQSPILSGKKHCVIFNGIDTEIFHKYDTTELRKKHGLTDEKIIFHATAGFSSDPKHLKGGYYVLELAKRLESENIKIIVAGIYEMSISKPSNMIFLGRISDQKLLAQYYSMADITIITSKKETFSMICAESLCCNTPVIGFKAGAPEQISLPEYSEFVEYGDVDSLCKSAGKIFDKLHIFDDIWVSAKKIYSKKVMVEKYKSLY